MNRTTRKDFHKHCRLLHQHLMDELHEVGGEEERRSYAFVLLTRLTFTYFLQQQGLLDGNPTYLRQHLELCRGEETSFTLFLSTLFYSGLSTPADKIPFQLRRMLGDIPHLSGSLFPLHQAERQSFERQGLAAPSVSIQVFEELLNLFEQYQWSLEEREENDGPENVITPAILGTLVENHVPERKSTGSYYTPADLCTYLVQQTCEPVILHRFEELTGQHYEEMEVLISALSARDCGLLLFVILPTLTILDPAVGAADFLVVALRKMFTLYTQIIERASTLHDPNLDGWLLAFDQSHPSRAYGLKKRVLGQNLFGVDIQQPPLDIARMRLCLNVLGSAREVREVKSLPNLDYALVRGNSLIGFDRLTDEEHRQLLDYCPQYDAVVKARNWLVSQYQWTIGDPLALDRLKVQIEACRQAAYPSLDRLLWEKVKKNGGASIERSYYDTEQGKTRKHREAFTLADLQGLDTFYWNFEFDSVMNHPWWHRLDGSEACVIQADDKLTVRFGGQQASTAIS